MLREELQPLLNHRAPSIRYWEPKISRGSGSHSQHEYTGSISRSWSKWMGSSLGIFPTEVGLHVGWGSRIPVKKQNNKNGLFKLKKTQCTLYKLPKRLHPNTDAYIDTDSDGNTEEVTTFFPNFLILELTEQKPITKLSSFVIEKFLSSNVAAKIVKTTCNSNLIVELTKKKYTNY